jgi:hypothetical protein
VGELAQLVADKILFCPTVCTLGSSRTDSGEAEAESHASSEIQPKLAALLLVDTTHIQPGSQLHQCVGGNTIHLATWSACTASGPPQESLVCDEGIFLPVKPSLTRMTLSQLCVAPWSSRSWPAATEPGFEPRISGGTASATMQYLRPLRHPGVPPPNKSEFSIACYSTTMWPIYMALLDKMLPFTFFAKSQPCRPYHLTGI